MIGLSVSFCIRDMVQGRVNPDTVEKIVAGTAATPDNFEELIRNYREYYWYECPDDAERLFRKMFAEGKIEQPRLTTGRAPMIAGGYWVENEDQIKWVR